MNIKLFTISAFFLSLIFACKTKQNPSNNQSFSTQEEIVLLDSLTATTAITLDSSNWFFKHITATDMSIQMKKPYSIRKNSLKEYRNFLKTEVGHFTEEEALFVNQCMTKAKAYCDALNPALFPNRVELIKTKGNHYGDNVYYTRENRIIIPQNVLEQADTTTFTKVMLHELFHIISRLNPKLQKQTYALIGFQSLGSLTDLYIPNALKNRILLNPDGVNFAQAITLQKGQDTTIQAIPIIYANQNEFVPTQPSFFEYLTFELFEIQAGKKKAYRVITNEDGSSTLKLEELPSFFEQIKDNTNYIIHPDEILADNFVILALNQPLDNFSEGGQSLLTALRQVLENVK